MNIMSDDSKAVLIATLLGFICVFNGQGITIALPYISSSLHISSVFANWISLAFFICGAATGLSCGKIMPKYGVIKTTKVFMVFTIIGAIISVISLNPFIIILGKAIQGFFVSGLFVTAYLIIMNQIDTVKIGRALGISTSGFFIAYLLAPIIGGFLITYVSWQALFLFMVPFCVLALILLFSFNNEWVEEYDVDKIGTVLWFILMVAFVYGLSFLDTSIGVISFVISLILMAIFVYYELQIDDPLYDFRLLKNLKYSVYNYAAMMIVFVVDGMMFVITLYLQHVKGLTSIETGFILGLMAAVLLVMSIVAGRLSDKYDSVTLSRLGIIIVLLSSILLAFSNYLPLYIIIIGLVVLAIGNGVFDTPTRRMILDIHGSSRLPEVSAFLSSVRDMGSLIALAVFTLILDGFSGIKDNVLYWAISSQYIFIIYILVSISVIVAVYYLNRKVKAV
ncbi:MAG: MFS transporter [archaeon]|nr:MFS transporter [archaeon]